MRQSKLASFLESCGNTATGFGLSLLFQYFVLVQLKGLPMSWQDNFEFALIMTVVSVARGFGWRRLMEFLHVRVPLSPFMLAVIAERHRQQAGEGWTAAHDDEHSRGELAGAGAAYLMTAGLKSETPPASWRWSRDFWKPTDFRRDLVKGCALGIAEGERFDRSKRSR